MLKRLDNIGIAVTNAEASIDFFVNTLGFEGEAQGSEGSVRLGDIALYIFESGSAATDVQRTTDYYNNPVGLDHLAFEVDDLEATCAELEGRGLVFDGAIVGEAGEFRYRGFKDPDGNMLYVIQHP
jgi:glyoxylase I family protein